MLGIHVICVGKLKEKFYTDASAEYAKRLGGYCKFQLTELPEERLPDNPSQAQIDAALRKEADAILQRLPKGCAVTPCAWREKYSPARSSAAGSPTGPAGPQPALLCHRLLLRTPSRCQGAGRPAPVHVQNDLPPPPGQGHAAGAALQGLQNRRGLQLHK